MQRMGFEETIAQLRANGVRLTPQRQWILRYLKETHDHPTAEQVHHAVSKALGGISLATVYNTLHTLTKLGVIRELSYGDGSSRFDGNETEHAHLVCERCGSVTDVESPGIANIWPPGAGRTGFEIRSYRLEFYGLCEACRVAEQQPSGVQS
ncbi:Fur family transcriptional regulator [Effusibacillus pohliae]|uniref:Fur family transcriptional regulator n=1 Tax=Effusibacillus pohliae TaxID=232270 RepID=UPI000382B451|nr:Fur family transcriptional regulator [Effusibacillus pohliae]